MKIYNANHNTFCGLVTWAGFTELSTFGENPSELCAALGSNKFDIFYTSFISSVI